MDEICPNPDSKINASPHRIEKKQAKILEIKNLGLFCGEDGIRTRDPLIANQVLYQLSYIPSLFRAAKVRQFSLQTAASEKFSEGHILTSQQFFIKLYRRLIFAPPNFKLKSYLCTPEFQGILYFIKQHKLIDYE